MAANRHRRFTAREVCSILLNDEDSEGPEINLEDSSDDDWMPDDDVPVKVSRRSRQEDAGDGATPTCSTAPPFPLLPPPPLQLPQQADRAAPGRRGGQRGRARGRGRGHQRGRRGACHATPAVEPVAQAPPAAGDEPAFTWEWYPMEDPFEQNWLPAFTRRRGVLVDTTDFSPVDYFQLFFPEETFQLLATETNRYATQFLEGRDLSAHSRFRKWIETDTSEMKAYAALQIAMGLCQKSDIEEYWSEWWLTALRFGDIMPRNRYEMLSSFLHFADNSVERPARGEAGHDPLWKVRGLMDICEPIYPAVYGPSKDLAIDESIIKYKGRIHFRQFLPSKPYRWGIKQYALCDSRTGYALKFITYCGKNSVRLRDGFSVTESNCYKTM